MSASSSISDAKRRLRREMRPVRDGLSADERMERSRRIFKRLKALALYRKAGLILFYASFGSEVDTWKMMEYSLRNGKRIALPKVEEDSGGLMALEIEDLKRDLYPGYMGIHEPHKGESRQVRRDEMGLIIVPGLVFDGRGYRLGYGKGYYDRFLSGLSPSIPSVGLAYDFQVVEALPISPEDFALDLVITDKRTIWGEKPPLGSKSDPDSDKGCTHSPPTGGDLYCI